MFEKDRHPGKGVKKYRLPRQMLEKIDSQGKGVEKDRVLGHGG